MENEPSPLDQLPPPTELPVPVELLGNLPIDPTVPQTVELAGPDEFRFSVLESPTTPSADLDALNTLPTTEPLGFQDRSAELVDAGSINLVPIGEAVDSFRISYHGLGFMMARNKEERARTKVEKINQKDVFYKAVTENYRNHLDGTVRPDETDVEREERIRREKPNTIMERFVANRLEKKAKEHRYAAKHRSNIEGSYGGEKSAVVGRKAKRIRKLQKKAVIQGYKRGDMTASEKNKKLGLIDATPVRLENSLQRKSNNKKNKATNKLAKLARHPIDSRWGRRRILKRMKLEGDQARYKNRADKHLQSAIDIKNSRP